MTPVSMLSTGPSGYRPQPPNECRRWPSLAFAISPIIDADEIVRAVRAGLPDADSRTVVSMLSAQLPYIDAQTGVALLDKVVTIIQRSEWCFTDADLDRWPEPVAQHAMACIRALPPGTDRIEALCQVAHRLTLTERREALDGILDATLPEISWYGGKPCSNDGTITYLVRTLPEEWQEEWLATKAINPCDGGPDPLGEACARCDIDRLTEAALRRMWSLMDHESTSAGGVPIDYLRVARHLPPDLKAQALARIRASTSQSDRLLHLVYFDSELTDAERREVVEVPWSETGRRDPRSQADHLQSVETHLPKVPLDVRRRWLQTALAFTEDYDLQRGLLALLPSLSGDDHQRAVDALVESVIREEIFWGDSRWDLLPDESLESLLHRLWEDAYSSTRGEVIAHLLDDRDAALADRCLPPLLDGLGDLDGDHCIEIVTELTPWLADHTAALPVHR